MIIAGESSGELYGSLLARELMSAWPGVRVIGVGGEKMRAAGVELVSGITSVFGLVEVLSSIKTVRETLHKTIEAMRGMRPQVVVCIDYPDFNFRVAEEAKRLGLQVLYYVSPQVWAWRRGRIKTLARIADRMAAVLPFEEDVYRGSGLKCEFVGHPITDEIASLPMEKSAARAALDIPADTPALTLMPGSRQSELKYMLPLFLQVARKLRAGYPAYRLLMPLAPNLDAGRYAQELAEFEREGVTVLRGVNAVVALAASECAVITSGTSSLQATLTGTPMVIVYRLIPLTYWIARLILKIKYITITNLVLGRPAVVELIQGRANEPEVMAEVHRMLNDARYRKAMLDDLGEVRGMFASKHPSRRVAAIIGEMAGWRK